MGYPSKVTHTFNFFVNYTQYTALTINQPINQSINQSKHIYVEPRVMNESKACHCHNMSYRA